MSKVLLKEMPLILAALSYSNAIDFEGNRVSNALREL
jgi:hypothetical protein